MDALAEAAGQDPVAFRLAHLEHNPRLAAVVAKAQEAWKGWTLAPGRHLGFAAHHPFATSVAQAAEVSVEEAPFACTACSAPWTAASPTDIVRAQMEGAIMYGLTAALHGKLDPKGAR